MSRKTERPSSMDRWILDWCVFAEEVFYILEAWVLTRSCSRERPAERRIVILVRRPSRSALDILAISVFPCLSSTSAISASSSLFSRTYARWASTGGTPKKQHKRNKQCYQ